MLETEERESVQAPPVNDGLRTASVVILAVAAAVAGLYFGRELFVPVVFAMLLNAVFRPDKRSKNGIQQHGEHDGDEQFPPEVQSGYCGGDGKDDYGRRPQAVVDWRRLNRFSLFRFQHPPVLSARRRHYVAPSVEAGTDNVHPPCPL